MRTQFKLVKIVYTEILWTGSDGDKNEKVDLSYEIVTDHKWSYLDQNFTDFNGCSDASMTQKNVYFYVNMLTPHLESCTHHLFLSSLLSSLKCL